jgi:hypothetical protein
MVKILNMQFIRYANLFSKITRVRTNHCFEYNNTIVFAVPRRFIGQSIGENNGVIIFKAMICSNSSYLTK